MPKKSNKNLDQLIEQDLKEYKEKEEKHKFKNYYELESTKPFIVEYNNPCYDFETMPLKHPMRALIVGCSGSGKSNVLLGIIEKMSDTFNEIKIFTQDKSEPLYEMLESKIEKPYLQIFEGLDDLKSMDMTKLEGQQLFIFDDMVVEPEKKQQKICELYIRGRKMSDKKGISLIYLTQSYYDVPNIIRKQANQLLLKKINGRLETNAIIRDCSALDLTTAQLQSMYSYCVNSTFDIQNVFLIDKSAPDGKNFRKNFNEILNVEDF